MDLSQIIDLRIANLNLVIGSRGLTVRLSDAARKWLIDKTIADRSYGARPLKRAIQKFVEDELSEALIQGDISESSDVEVNLADGRFVFTSVATEIADVAGR